MNSNWTFFMIQLISCIPLGKYIYSSAKKIIDDQIKLKESLDFSKKINFNLADLSDVEIEALVVTLQNKIYSIRKKVFFSCGYDLEKDSFVMKFGCGNKVSVIAFNNRLCQKLM